MPANALVLAPVKTRERIITGLKLGERGRRVAVRAGVAPDRVHVVRSAAELADARAQLSDGALLFIRASGHVVALALVEPLDQEAAGTRVSVGDDGTYAGAIKTDGPRTAELLAALATDFEAGDATAASRWSEAAAPRVEVSARARHPVGTRAQVRAADAWQFELTHKQLDNVWGTYLHRPLARPFTRMFLRLPFSPNVISLISSAVSLAGCFIAAQPEWKLHVIGLAILFFGAVLDACDGEVARLRMEESKLGAWLDAIGDDIARLALVAAMGFHLAPNYPSWPVLWTMTGALATTLTSMVLIYWYCIFVIGSSSNQDYEAAMGVGNATDVPDRGKSIVRIAGDVASGLVRRVFIDPAVLVLALFGLSWLSFIGLALGSVVALAFVLPTHFRLVQAQRDARQSE